MKKTILVLLTLALLTTAFTGCANLSESNVATTTAETAEQPNPASDFEYKDNSDGGITITKYIGTDTDVIIPEQIDGKTVTVIGQLAFASNDIITSVIMPDSVIIIDTAAFCGCDNLSTVVLSKNLERIQDEAFNNSQNLSNITLPDSLIYIGSTAFAHCKSLKHITIPAKCFADVDENFISYANTMMIFSYSGLETLEFAEGVEYIPNAAFSHTNLKEVVVPGSVKIISKSAFAGCEKLEKVTLNEGIKSIEASVFENTQVTEIKYPSTLEYLEGMPYEGSVKSEY